MALFAPNTVANVVCYDIDEMRIEAYRSCERERIEQYINEPGLVSVIKEQHRRGLTFTTTINDEIEDVEAIFMCLNTPPQRDGATDMTLLSQRGAPFGRIVGTPHIDTSHRHCQQKYRPHRHRSKLARILMEHNAENVGVASNPEFLAQGKAVEGSRRPDRVVVGADTPEDLQILRRLYSQFVNHVRIRYTETTPERPRR